MINYKVNDETNSIDEINVNINDKEYKFIPYDESKNINVLHIYKSKEIVFKLNNKFINITVDTIKQLKELCNDNKLIAYLYPNNNESYYNICNINNISTNKIAFEALTSFYNEYEDFGKYSVSIITEFECTLNYNINTLAVTINVAENEILKNKDIVIYNINDKNNVVDAPLSQLYKDYKRSINKSIFLETTYVKYTFALEEGNVYFTTKINNIIEQNNTVVFYTNLIYLPIIVGNNEPIYYGTILISQNDEGNTTYEIIPSYVMSDHVAEATQSVKLTYNLNDNNDLKLLRSNYLSKGIDFIKDVYCTYTESDITFKFPLTAINNMYLCSPYISFAFGYGFVMINIEDENNITVILNNIG